MSIDRSNIICFRVWVKEILIQTELGKKTHTHRSTVDNRSGSV